MSPDRKPIPPVRVTFSDVDRASVLGRVDAALRSGSLTLGPFGREFEDAFAARHGAAQAVAVASGTAALEIIFRALGLEGGEVVVPANTFYATAGAVELAGATPRFADVTRDTLALSAATVAAALTPATRAVVLVHIGGVISPEVRAIAALCEERGVALIEDAAHAHGSSLDGRPAGSWGRAAAWSFYPTKVVTSGEGGMITTADNELADEARIYRDQGKASFLGGGHVRLGAAWRMSELHAAVGVVHLARLDEFLAVRQAAIGRYRERLQGVPGLEVPTIPEGCAANGYKFPVLLGPGIDRDDLKGRLRERFGVSLSGEVYATPLHREPIFATLSPASLPVAEEVCARQVCLPVFSDQTDEEVDAVVDALVEELQQEKYGTGQP
jgi:perosamine synthetase